MHKLISLLLFLAFFVSRAMSQEVEMADQFRSDGKIYVVVIVLSIIVVGLFGYLFYLDKKISSREKN